MAHRIRLIRPEKQPKMIWSTSGGMMLFIIMCVMMVVLIQMLRSPGFLGFMLPKEPAKKPIADQPSPTEQMQEKEEATRPKLPPRPHVALSPEEEKKLLSTVKDQEPLEPKPYFYLLAKINSMTDAQINAGIDPTITYDTFAEEGGPARARGKLVRLQGYLKRLKETKITDSLTSGFDSVWEGTIIDNDLRPVTFVLTQRPRKSWLEPNRDYVVVKGFFVKNIAYRNLEGGFTASPMILAKDLVKIVPPPAGTGLWASYKQYIIIGLIIVGVMGLMFLEYQRRLRSALALRPRRASSESLEVVADTDALAESEEEPASEQETQHVNPGPSQASTSEEKAGEDKKPEEEKKDEGEKKPEA